MEKLYLYGIIKSTEDKDFGILDMAAKEPKEIKCKCYKDLGVIYSMTALEEDEEIMATRKNLINHQKAIERVMEEHNILPFAFGMVTDDFDSLSSILDAKATEFYTTLDSIEGKIELSLKGMWDDMEAIYKHITETNEEILALKEKIIQSGSQDQNDKIELGKKVEYALTLEKERLSDLVITTLKEHYEDYRMNPNISDSMFCNLAFLVLKESEKTFDEAINKLGAELNTNITFKYVGPLPPYNFLD